MSVVLLVNPGTIFDSKDYRGPGFSLKGPLTGPLEVKVSTENSSPVNHFCDVTQLDGVSWCFYDFHPTPPPLYAQKPRSFLIVS